MSGILPRVGQQGNSFLTGSNHYMQQAIGARGQIHPGQTTTQNGPDKTVGAGIMTGLGGAVSGSIVGAELGKIGGRAGGPAGAAIGAGLGLLAYAFS